MTVIDPDRTVIDVPESSTCPLCGYAGAVGRCGVCGGQVLDGPLGRPVRPARRMWPVEVVHGFRDVWRAAVFLLTRPEYFGRLKLPVAASIVAFVVLAAIIGGPVYHVAEWVAAAGSGPVAWLRGVGSWNRDGLALSLTVVVAVVLGPAVLQTLTAPFVEPLVDAIEGITIGGALPRRRTGWWEELQANVRSSARVLTLQLLVLPVGLVLAFWGVGLAVVVAVAAWLGALLWFELPFARRGVTVERRIAVLKANWARVSGLGLAVVLGMVVPVFNVLLLVPAAVVGAAMVYVHLDKTAQG